MKRLIRVLVAAAAAFTPWTAAAEPAVPEILRRFAADFRSDPSWSTQRTFGIQVDGARWHVIAEPASDGREATVELRDGFPAEPCWYFSTDAETLGRLDRGELNALTAMGRARENDPAPMDALTGDGFAPGDGFVGELLATAFHFWTRGLPERVPFGPATTRAVHGAQATIFFYQPGFRSGYIELRPGQHANADPRDQTNPFPSLFVTISGRAKARIGGREIDLVAREAIFIPAGSAHEFWNPYSESAEGILLMFGDGA